MNALSPFRLTGVTLEERVHVRRTREIEHEREIALYDLLEANSFKLVGSSGGPYKLVLGIEERRLTFDIHLENGEPHGKLILSLTPFRRAIKSISKSAKATSNPSPTTRRRGSNPSIWPGAGCTTTGPSF